MNTDMSDHGLQPERTLMSWFRTYLLLIIICFILLFVSVKIDLIFFKLLALTLILFTMFSLVFQLRRFKHFSSKNVVTNNESIFKMAFSFFIGLTAFSYAGFLIIKIFTP